MKKKKIWIALVLGVFLIPLIIAPPVVVQQLEFAKGYAIEFPSIGPHQVNNDFTFAFHIYNISNGIPISNSSASCAFHLYDTNGSHTYENSNIPYRVGEINNEWEITLDGKNFSYVGDYSYIIQCNSSSLGGFASLDFEVTTTGNPLPEAGESILYFTFVIILFGILLTIIYFICALPSENDKEDGVVIGIVKLKYLRILLIAMSYPMIIMILNLLNGLAVNFVSLAMFSGIIGFLFEMMLRGAWIFTIIIAIWIFYLLIRDSNFKKLFKKMGRPV